MSLQTVTDLSDAVPLETSLGLYLKPVSSLKINVQLPKLSAPGQSISTWHIMEKLKELVRPDSFLNLRSLKITPSVIKFEGELETKSSCDRALARLKAAGSFKVNGFSDKLQVRAAVAAAAGPTRHDWEAFFRDAKNTNEMRPGERPDTIHLSDLPIIWFSDSQKHPRPSEKLVRLAFAGFGKIRRIEMPVKIEAEDGIGKTGLMCKDGFEVYVQYEEYVEFSIAMDALRGQKLLYEDSSRKVYSADIKVDFDRTKYLSETSIKKREAAERKSKANYSKKEKKIIHDTSPTTSILQEKIQPVTDTPSPPQKVTVKTAHQIIEDLKGSQLQAENLLRGLLLRAEKTERLKVEALKPDVEPQLYNTPQKCISIETLSETLISKSNTKSKIKQNPPDKKSSNLKTDDTKHTKISKQTLIDKPKTEVSKHHKRNPKKDDYELKDVSKQRESSSKTSKEKQKTAICSSTKHKEKYKSSAKIVPDEKATGSEKKYSESASSVKKIGSKSSHPNCDKSTKDLTCDKKRKSGEVNDNSDMKNKIQKVESEKSHSQANDKKVNQNVVYVEVNLETKKKEEQKKMLLVEKRLKERLVQSYLQKQRNQEKLLEQERILKEKLVKKLKAKEEEKLREKEELRKKLSGSKILRSVVGERSSSKRH